MTSYEPIDWYDVPRYYDIIFGVGTREEADFLERMAREWGRPGRTVLEPGCGSGRLMLELARRGWKTAGFDLNDQMLQYARRRLQNVRPRARLFKADLAGFDAPGRYDLAHCLVSTFKYVLTEADARQHLVSTAHALRPGGIYVLGFHLTDYADRTRSRERWVARRGQTQVTSNLQVWPANRRTRLENVRARLRVTTPRSVRTMETQWQFRTYSVRQVKQLMAAVPVFEHVATYDFDYRRPRPLDGGRLDVVLVLRRR